MNPGAFAQRKLAVGRDIVRIAWIKAQLRAFGFARTVAACGLQIERRREKYRSSGASAILPEYAERVSVLQQACRRWPGQVTCLERSLVFGSTLRHRGACLAIGVAPDGNDVAAHAWLEVAGSVVELLPESGNVDFVVLGR